MTCFPALILFDCLENKVYWYTLTIEVCNLLQWIQVGSETSLHVTEVFTTPGLDAILDMSNSNTNDS